MITVVLVVAVWLALAVIVVLALRCAERGERQAALTRHPAATLPRAVAVFCGSCHRPVRYQVHPAGRRDALILHAAYECYPSMSATRRKQEL